MMGMGRIGFLISDAFEQALVKLVDGDMRPLWLPNIREGEPDMILGWPYEVSGALTGGPTSDPAVRIGYFGNFEYWGLRTVGQVDMFRFFDSRTAQNNSIENLAFSRRDGRAMGAQGAAPANGTEAIRAYLGRT